MSDTPISDSTPHNVADLGMLCRRLERELTASNAIIRQQQLLDEANLRLQERIERLEEELERTKQDRNAIAKKTREPLLLKLDHAAERIKLLEAVTNDPHALWANWLRGSVALPVGIGDVREYQDRIKRLEQENDALRADLLLWNEKEVKS